MCGKLCVFMPSRSKFLMFLSVSWLQVSFKTLNFKSTFFMPPFASYIPLTSYIRLISFLYPLPAPLKFLDIAMSTVSYDYKLRACLFTKSCCLRFHELYVNTFWIEAWFYLILIIVTTNVNIRGVFKTLSNM